MFVEQTRGMFSSEGISLYSIFSGQTERQEITSQHEHSTSTNYSVLLLYNKTNSEQVYSSWFISSDTTLRLEDKQEFFLGSKLWR